jgi:uncharacterized membrane protein
MLPIIFIIIAIGYIERSYYVYLDMSNNPEENRPMLFLIKGIVFCIVSLYFCMTLSLHMDTISIIVFFFLLGACSLYFGFKLRKLKENENEI